MNFRTERPADAGDLRRGLYQGELFRLPATAASRRLVADAVACIADGLGVHMRAAQFRLSDAEFFEKIGRLRKHFHVDERFHALVRALIEEQGFDVARCAFDPARLRAVAHKGHENPRAAPVCHAHRDIWHAHSQAEITWWVPLHDVTAEETFAFYPGWFRRPVPNNSEQFDYDLWTRNGPGLRIGWQNPSHGATQLHPGLTGEFEPGAEVSVAASAGEIVLFAGAHFHQTRRNATGRTRFSLDFRVVDLDDHAAGLGAPNVDNRSTGSAIRDYVQPSR